MLTSDVLSNVCGSAQHFRRRAAWRGRGLRGLGDVPQEAEILLRDGYSISIIFAGMNIATIQAQPCL